MNTWYYWVGVLVILGFAALGVMEMQNAATPYLTSIDEVKKYPDRQVQFFGYIVEGKTAYDESNDELSFQLKDEKGKTLFVKYHGVKPANFDNVKSIVVIGKVIRNNFYADKILTKCPSKYKNKS